MGCDRTYEEIKDKILCFRCKKFLFFELWNTPVTWHGRCSQMKKTITYMPETCVHFESLEEIKKRLGKSTFQFI